jgi:hypothetical protein
MTNKIVNPILKKILKTKDPIELREKYRKYVENFIQIDDILYDDFIEITKKSHTTQSNRTTTQSNRTPKQEKNEIEQGMTHLVTNINSKLKTHTSTKVIKLISYLFMCEKNTIHTGITLKQKTGLVTLAHYTVWKRSMGQYKILLQGEKRGTYIMNPDVRNSLKPMKKDLIEF